MWQIPRDKLVIFTGAFRLWEVLARLRHAVRRGAPPLCRVAFVLCQTVFRTARQAGRRFDRRAVPCDFHRSEDHLQKSPFHGRDRDGDLRLSASALREDRHPALSGLRQRDPEDADGRSLSKKSCRSPRGRGSSSIAPAVSGQKGHARKGVRRRPQKRICARACGRLCVFPRRGSGTGQK